MLWYSVFTTFSLFGTIVALLFAWLAWRTRRRHVGAISCMIMLLGVAIWTGAYAIEQTVEPEAAKIFWHRVSYFGIPVVPVAWFLFNLQLNDIAQKRFRLWAALLSIEPIVVWLVGWSGNYEPLWNQLSSIPASEVAPATSYPMPILSVDYGPLFYVHTIFSYTLLLAGTILFTRHVFRAMPQNPGRIVLLILGILTPIFVNVLRVLDIYPFNFFDATPIVLSTMGTTAAWYIFRFPLRDLLMLAQREVLAEIGDGVIVLDLQNRVTNLNTAAQSLLSMSEREALRQPVEALLPGSALAIHRHLEMLNEQAQSRGKSVRYAPAENIKRITVELTLPRQRTAAVPARPLVDEREESVHIEVSIFPLMENAKMATGCVLILRDVTRRVLAETKLRANHKRYHDLVEMVPDAILVGDSHLYITSSNHHAAELYGIDDADELVGLRLVDLLLEADVTRFLSNVYKMIEKDHEYSDIYSLRRQDGEMIEVELQLMLVRDKENLDMPVGFLASMRDITERLRQEETNRRIQKIESISLLAGGLAHDFNNLLTGMMTQGSMALKQATSSDSVYRYIQQMMQMARHAASLSQQLAAYSGREQLEVEPANFDRLVEESLALLEPNLPPSLHISHELQTAPCAIEADRRQMQLVIQNLVLKAIDAAGRRPQTAANILPSRQVYVHAYPKILVNDESDAYGFFNGTPHTPSYEQNDEQIFVQQSPLKGGHYLCLSVSTDEPAEGLKQEEHVFDPYFTAPAQGSGLGLSVLLGIIRAHDGGLEVEHEEGHDARFRIYLPIADNALYIDEEEALVNHPPPVLSGHALVVDDNAIVRETLAEALRFMGMSTSEAGDGREGVDCYRAQHPHFDLVLLDMKMPVMDGAEALTEMRALNPHIRVLLTSGYVGETSVEDLLQMTNVEFLHKPYSIDELAESVQKLLKGPS